jgi:hypothetical protein
VEISATVCVEDTQTHTPFFINVDILMCVSVCEGKEMKGRKEIKKKKERKLKINERK